MEKESFVFYATWLDVMEDMSNEEQLEYLKAIAMYGAKGQDTKVSRYVKGAMSFVKRDIDAAQEKYERICEKRREAGKKGAEKTNATRWGVDKSQQMSANADSSQQMSANIGKSQHNDNVNDNDNDNVNDNVNDNEDSINRIHSPHTPQGAEETEVSSLKERLIEYFVENCPDDKVERNAMGLIEILVDFGFGFNETTDILKATDFGRLGHNVWKGIAKINNEGFKPNNIKAYIKACMSGKKA